MTNIRRFNELDIYQLAMDSAMRIFEASKVFPVEERYSLTDQIRRSSRSVCANISEAWHIRRYPRAFVSKLSDADAEAAETQVWLEFTNEYDYMDSHLVNKLIATYNNILGKLVIMMNHPEDWRIR